MQLSALQQDVDNCTFPFGEVMVPEMLQEDMFGAQALPNRVYSSALANTKIFRYS